MKLSLSISSCPNDTFMFDALINKKIDTKNYNFDLNIADVENLNQLAFSGESDITKISYHAFFKVIENYQLLTSGGALGENCGPLLISKKKIYPDELHDCKIAIPGDNTTAKLLLDMFYPTINKHKKYLFSDIEEAVLENECDAGLVIHETRFTYKDKGLKLIADLGDLWESKYKLPTPLGGIAIKRDLPESIKLDINRLLKESIEYSFSNPQSPINFMKQHAVELSEDIMQKHVKLYVNKYSINIDKLGKDAIYMLYKHFQKANDTNVEAKDIFV